MDIFQRFWQWLLSIFIKKELNITVIGLPNAGKTTFVKALANQNTTVPTTPTIGAQFSSLSIGNLKVNVSDMSGSQSFTFLWSIYAKQADLIIYVVDAADYESILQCQNNLESLFEDAHYKNKPLIVIANKQDIPGCISAEDLYTSLQLKDEGDRKIQIFALSAKTKQNFSPLLRYLVENF
ncbi:small GTP-binding protein, putative [Trichomonas vaginalis G3]|uniref:Small GTP-binding protein, putative n=1 Tax=Trichomonas vaginalis (strain ATCC PRA-98 / G3) TaxID=412133 RepID=A2E4S5_TRIV3|nr:small GTPase superfamily, Arf family [Trichomonas vaginalis G3]EAY12385.1 small GTP-binding protein, putative [Trichomonas vaginalis G3]KAI5500802.1 small GTPase superfamily, Arf family [Trichomonas vaginalis G3]|eukprot:XP_001324608.1 small GTP-binding protein [Trichomonas vaginalis G3]